MKYKIEIELDDADARRIQSVVLANNITWEKFAEYAMVSIAEIHAHGDLIWE